MSDAELPPGAMARGLLRRADRAALATRLAGGTTSDLAPGLADWPYSSLVLLAADHNAAPLLLMSDLSEHSRNIAADNRVSLLIDGTAGRVDPLTGPRVSLLGRAGRTTDARLRARFIARHPAAAFYAGFADFHLYRVALERSHFVAGFGRIHWIAAADLACPAAPALAGGEAELIAALNDSPDLPVALARRAGARGGSGWRITGVDPEGIDLRRKGAVARLGFAMPVQDAAAARAAIDALAAEAPATRS